MIQMENFYDQFTQKQLGQMLAARHLPQRKEGEHRLKHEYIRRLEINDRETAAAAKAASKKPTWKQLKIIRRSRTSQSAPMPAKISPSPGSTISSRSRSSKRSTFADDADTMTEKHAPPFANADDAEATEAARILVALSQSAFIPATRPPAPVSITTSRSQSSERTSPINGANEANQEHALSFGPAHDAAHLEAARTLLELSQSGISATESLPAARSAATAAPPNVQAKPRFCLILHGRTIKVKAS